MSGANQRIDKFDILIQTFLVAFIIFPPLAHGSVAPWARGALLFLALMLLALWLLQGAWRGELRVVRSSAWFFILAFFAIALFQLFPLAPDLLKTVSPVTAETYANTLINYPESGEARTVSLSPYATGAEIERLCILAIVFFITVNATRTRWQIVSIIMALAAIGLFEALYGLYEHFSGNYRIFWVQRKYSITASGTFINRNHFAGLLEMVVPVCLGYIIALGEGFKFRKTTHRSNFIKVKERFILAISSRDFHIKVLLGAACALMVVAIIFSRSRSGITFTLISLILFTLFLAFSKGLRHHMAAVLIVGAVTIGFSSHLGLEGVISGIDVMASGESGSIFTRLDLIESGLDYAGDYPLLGSGLGTLRLVYPRYQSPRYGDRVVEFLHNDWLQLFCETGLIGWLTLVSGLCFFFFRTSHAAFNREDVFCKWVATGALLGVSVMLLHSLTDFNLYKVTSNGITFVVLLGISFAAAHIPGRKKGSDGSLKYWTLRVRPAPLRMTIIIVGIMIVIYWPVVSYPSVKADIAFNQYRAETGAFGGPDLYFFLKTDPPPQPGNTEMNKNRTDFTSPLASSREKLERALQLDTGNHLYLYAAAKEAMAHAEKLVEKKAYKSARAILGDNQEKKNQEELKQLIRSLMASLRRQMLDERKLYLSMAEKYLSRAIDAAPSLPIFHITLANVISELDPLSREVAQEAERAIWLDPNKPETLFKVGRVLLVTAYEKGSAENEEQSLSKVRRLFRQAIYSDPSYTDRVYPLVEALLGGREALFDVTPETLQAYEALYNHYKNAGDYENALICLDVIERLGEAKSRMKGYAALFAKGDAPSPRTEAKKNEALLTRGATAADYRTPSAIGLSVAKRRVFLLTRLGRLSERTDAIKQYRILLREKLKEDILKADAFRNKGRVNEAMSIYLGVLQKDWGNPDALLAAAELSDLPAVLNNVPLWNQPLDYLFRLIINNSSLPDHVYKRAVKILDGLSFNNQPERVVAEFVRGAGAILAGRFNKGLTILQDLSNRKDEATHEWRNRHLIWHFIGLGYDRAGDRQKAIHAYRKTVDIVPNLFPSLERLCKLNGGDATYCRKLTGLTPKILINESFGGKITFLGYDLSREKVPVNFKGVKMVRDEWFMTCYWLLNDRMHEVYRPVITLHDSDWRSVAYNNQPIKAGGQRYETEFPRVGEVIVEKRRLGGDLLTTKYLRIMFYAANPPRLAPKRIMHSWGKASLDFPILTTLADIEEKE